MSGLVQYAKGFLAREQKRISQPAEPGQNVVWLLDSTAYRHPAPNGPGEHQSWHAEVTACVFSGDTSKDSGEFVAKISDDIGLDGRKGDGDPDKRKRMEDRLKPFLDPVSSGTVVRLEIPVPIGHVQTHTVGPSDDSGVSTQDVRLGRHHVDDGTVLHPRLHGWDPDHPVTMNMIFADPEGWLVVSDIDDTIKHTQTPDVTGILRTTFAEQPKPIDVQSLSFSAWIPSRQLHGRLDSTPHLLHDEPGGPAPVPDEERL